MERGASVTLLEPASFGKAITATRVGGNTEVLDSVSVPFVEPGDVARLVAAPERPMAEEALRERLRDGMRRRFAERPETADRVSIEEKLLTGEHVGSKLRTGIERSWKARRAQVRCRVDRARQSTPTNASVGAERRTGPADSAVTT